MNYATFHSDGTLNQRLIKGTHVIPGDAIEIDAALWQKLICDAGGIWIRGADGEITQQPFPEHPLTREDVERQRLAAYADPSSGSDRYFAEASRMQMMGEPGWEKVRDAGIKRFNDIQALYPWPDETHVG